ncbi:MAG: hypothetical protein DI586_06375 [Micavibrio aeruginosavorus]|uniref:Autotransporter domain-containing protein n=1 Tax=Micavibrio aeruginosavorus TaxID=349221 RepID=A0A2W5HP62_9BACT|nr:MAG: hypothetical protein DI586_06375 [Micavibrio aeruginosavorus]
MTRARLLSGTALIGIMTFALFPGQVMAACSTNIPTTGAIVTCTGTDTVGISGGANNVQLNIETASAISTIGANAIELGTGSVIDIKFGTASVSSNLTAINISGGTIFANGTISGGNGTAINFGNSNANLNLYSASNIIGNVIAGSTGDLLQLRNGGGTLNVNDIGTKYIGFDQFTKSGAGTWILTGTGNQAWNITGGTLQGDTSSMSGNLAVSSGANVTFDLGTSGTTSGIISGAGTVTKTSSGTLTLAGANTYSGGTIVNGGIVAVSADNNLGTGALTLNGGTLRSGAAYSNSHNISLGTSNGTIDTNGFNTTASGVISGTGSLTKTGTGTLTLSGANSFSGGLIISAGQIAATPGTLGVGNVVNSGTLFFNTGSNGTYNGIISGTGNLVKQLAGTVTLTGASTYTGSTSILGGALNVSADNNIGATSSNLTLNGGTLQSGAAYTNTHAISLGASNGTIDTNGFATTISGIISGAGSLTKTGNGTLTLSGTNTYSGGTTISGTNASALNVSADNNLGAASGILTLDGGQLQYGASFNSARSVILTSGTSSSINMQSYNSTLSGILSGAGSFGKNGTGTLTLTGTNTFTGDAGIYNGTLNINSDSALGTGAKNIYMDNGTLQFASGFTLSNSKQIAIGSNAATIDTNSNNVTLAGLIRNTGSSTGQLVKTGAGTLTLSGSNTYVGGTTISGGTLNVSANSNLGTGSVTLNGGTLQSGAAYTNTHAMSLGASGGTIDTNGFNTTISSVLSGTGSLTKTGSGTLYLSGANTYTGDTIISAGTLSASSQSILGNITNNGSMIFSGANGAYAGTISGTGGVLVSNTTTLSGTNTYSGGTSMFNGGTLAVSADANLGTGYLFFNNGTLQYNSGFSTAKSVSLSTGGGIINTNGFNSTLSGVISGTGSLTKSGTGTLTLSGTNTYSGGTTIAQGALSVSSDSNLGNASGGLTLSGGGSLSYTTGFSSARNINVVDSGIINTSSNSATLSGIISGGGVLTKSGSGVLTLSGSNTYSGGTTIANGTISATADNNLGTGALTLNGGTLQYGASFDSAKNITVGASGGTINITGSLTSNLSGIISGAGTLTKSGNATLTLSGNNTYTGGTVATGGNLRISSDANLGDINSSLTLDTARLVLISSLTSARNIILGTGGGSISANGSNSTITGIISGTGALTKISTGMLTLSGANTYSGGTTVSGGTLSISANNNLGTGALTLNGGTLRSGAAYTNTHAISLGASNGTIDTNGFNTTASGVISGAGSLTKSGTGTLILSGTNTYSGGTSVTGGVLEGNTGSIKGSAAISSGSNLTFNQTSDDTYSGVISGAGSLTKAGFGVLVLSGTNTYSGGTTISAGALVADSTTLPGNVTNNSVLAFSQASTGTYSGIISGTGSVIKAGSGTLTLSGNNTYSGGTIISTGTLVGTTTSLQGDISNDSVVAFNQTTNGTYAGDISGTGGFIKAGSGNVTLTGTNTYSGGTMVSAGTLTGTTDNLQGDIDNNAAVVFNQSIDDIYSGAMSGLGTLTKTGAGNLTLSGMNTYSGGTTISAGTLNGTTDSIQGDVINNAALSFDQAFNGTYAGIISGTGSLTKTGIGNLILSATNTYSGNTTVSDGRLSVNGTIAGTTTVASAGTLGGNGNFGAIVANGRIAPGNSIGTMNVTGPVTFNSGSIYEVEVNAAGNSDKLIATGAITINGGTVDVRAASGTYADTNVYNNIIEGSSRTGMFSGVTTDLMFLTPTLSYDATSVDLIMTRNDVEFNTVAADEVQAGVANAVQGLGSGNDLYTAFSGLNMQEASAALDTLSGEHNAGITTATAQSASVIQNVISNRVQALGSKNIASLSPAAGDDEDIEIKKSFWSEVFGSRGNSDAQGTAPAQNRESSGALFGGDAELPNDVFVGAFGGYEVGEVYTNTQNANSDVNSYHAGLYANKMITSSWRISTSLIGSYHDINTTRHIQFTGFSETPKGNTNGYTVTPSIETGYSFMAHNINIEPFMGLSLTHSYIDSYSEKDGGSANLDVDHVSQTNASHMLGLRVSKSLRVLDETSINFTARAGWNHVYGDLDTSQTMQFSAGTTPFDVKGAGLARNSAAFGAGADIALGFNDATAYVNYAGEVSKDTDNHGVTLGIKVPF